MDKNKKTILAIETSCDETAASVLTVRGGGRQPEIETLSSVVKSQTALHSKMGGVVPEAAARAHVRNIVPVTQKALTDAFLFPNPTKKPHMPLTGDRQKTGYDFLLKKVDYIAVTAGPGLIPSLIVGVEFAKALSLATKKPMIPVNHMLGHLYSPFKEIRSQQLEIREVFPQIALVVSGGHTMLVLVANEKKYRVLGQTLDDAAGEAFDKVAKLLSLPYPGGPEVSKLAMEAKQPVAFPRPMINSKGYNFSFAGLKTAVLYHLRDNPNTNPAGVCAGFQNAVVDVLTAKTMKAVKEFKAKSISLSGGVAANKRLRETLQAASYRLQAKFFAPPFNLCTDNAEMIGLAAAFLLHNGYKPKSYKTVKADPNLPL